MEAIFPHGRIERLKNASLPIVLMCTGDAVPSRIAFLFGVTPGLIGFYALAAFYADQMPVGSSLPN